MQRYKGDAVLCETRTLTEDRRGRPERQAILVIFLTAH